MTSKLKKMRIGDLISISDEVNKDGYDYPFFGVNINKEFMPTMASTSGLDRKKYKIIRKNRFVFSGMQTGRDKCIRISLYQDEQPVLVSPAYTTFEIISTEIVPAYFFMIFKSDEMDRYGAFLSDSSVRANLDWNRFCEIELLIPPIEIQVKYLAIYESLVSNLKCHDSNLDDFYNATEIFLMKLKEKYDSEPIGTYIFEKNERNKNLEVNNVEGVKKDKTFIPTIANMNGIELSNYKIVRKGDFAYSNRINIGSIALKRDGCCIVSPSYTVFGVKEGLIPEYLLMWFCRENFLHYAFYYSMGTVKDELDFKELSNMPIPIPPIELQMEAVKLSSLYFDRVNRAETIKKYLNNICPVLIRGSILEAEGGETKHAN